jgi:methionyl-tRNA synthetase
VHGWLLVGGEKMAKSAGNKVDPLELVEDFGLDAVRDYLLRDTNFGSDDDFTYEALTARYNSDLANNLGNLLQRVTTVVANKLDGRAPQPAIDSPLALVAAQALNRAKTSWNEFAPQDALEAVWSLIHETNARLEAVAPWKMEAGEELESVLGDALECLRLVCTAIYPVMPDTASEVWARIGLDGSPKDQDPSSSFAWGVYRSAKRIEKGTPLFPRRK